MMKTAFTVCFVYLQFVQLAHNPDSHIQDNWIYILQFSLVDRDQPSPIICQSIVNADTESIDCYIEELQVRHSLTSILKDRDLNTQILFERLDFKSKMTLKV